jgi:hypothetical protein
MFFTLPENTKNTGSSNISPYRPLRDPLAQNTNPRRPSVDIESSIWFKKKQISGMMMSQ